MSQSSVWKHLFSQQNTPVGISYELRGGWEKGSELVRPFTSFNRAELSWGTKCTLESWWARYIKAEKEGRSKPQTVRMHFLIFWPAEQNLNNSNGSGINLCFCGNPTENSTTGEAERRFWTSMKILSFVHWAEWKKSTSWGSKRAKDSTTVPKQWPWSTDVRKHIYCMFTKDVTNKLKWFLKRPGQEDKVLPPSSRGLKYIHEASSRHKKLCNIVNNHFRTNQSPNFHPSKSFQLSFFLYNNQNWQHKAKVWTIRTVWQTGV